MFFQVAQGFEYLKKHNIMHRDLKPANILIHKGVYKIADFGLAKFSDLGASVM
jgi:serine/threonine-protein kinase ULK/ATG1